MASPGTRSWVKVENLQLPHPVLAPNVWGIAKPQPATLSLSIELNSQFSDSEGSDNLANSINYGELSKQIRGQETLASATPAALLHAIHRLILDMGARPNNVNIISTIDTSLKLPKASMTGEAHIFRWVSISNPEPHLARGLSLVQSNGISYLQKSLSIPKMNLMVLIGINDYERQAKQPIIASMILAHAGVNAKSDNNAFPEEAACDVEQVLVQAIEGSAFDTLEALVHFAAGEVKKYYVAHAFGDATVHFTLEKPKAVPYADAAVVEHILPVEGR